MAALRDAQRCLMFICVIILRFLLTGWGRGAHQLNIGLMRFVLQFRIYTELLFDFFALCRACSRCMFFEFHSASSRQRTLVYILNLIILIHSLSSRHKARTSCQHLINLKHVIIQFPSTFFFICSFFLLCYIKKGQQYRIYNQHPARDFNFRVRDLV